MRKFEYTIKDALGIHARPAGSLAKIAKDLDSEVTVFKGMKFASATKIMALMGLGAKQGDILTVTVEGGDEVASESVLKEFFEKNL